jgi:hypothetical protein
MKKLIVFFEKNAMRLWSQKKALHVQGDAGHPG